MGDIVDDDGDEEMILPADTFAITWSEREGAAMHIPHSEEDYEFPAEALALVGCGMRLLTDPAFATECAKWAVDQIEKTKDDEGERDGPGTGAQV